MKRKAEQPTSLFGTRSEDGNESTPLAERVRPRRLSDLLGQDELFGESRPLAQAIEADRVRSLILWGPPGSGKTTLARIVAETSKAHFVAQNAVLCGVADIRDAVASAREERRYHAKRTILFIDEIHRFNKAQQDALLPHVEDGTITLIGATTENPSFAVNAPLLSRCKVVRLRTLELAVLCQVLERACQSPTGLAGSVTLEEEACRALARAAQGDARRALTALELLAADVLARGQAIIGVDDVVAQHDHKTLLYDKAGEEHFNVASALIKSLRGSDPDASIYWMMRMVEAGDDPLFILRRLIIFASEDIGNADPRALELTVAADAAFRRLGMPEGLYAMSQACLYLAAAPKSNASTVAFGAARQAIAETGTLAVPLKLRNAPTSLMKREGYGQGYRYAPDEPDGFASGETYLPEELAGRVFYEPTGRGFEKNIGERLKFLKGGKPTDD